MENIKCPKCDGEMEKGVFGDRGYYSAIAGSIRWGTSINFWGLKDQKNVIVYKCKKCGYLEGYAK